MVSTLLFWLCTNAAMTDCQVYGVSQWQGPSASQECEAERIRATAEVHRKAPKLAFRFECETEPTGE